MALSGAISSSSSNSMSTIRAPAADRRLSADSKAPATASSRSSQTRRFGTAIVAWSAGCGATRSGRPVPRVARRIVVRVEAERAEGELGHVGGPEDDRAGGAEPGYDGRVLGRGRTVRQRLRSGERRVAADVAQVLDRDRNPGERRGDDSMAARPVGGERRIHRGIPEQADEGARTLPVRVVDPVEALGGQRGRGRAALGQIPGEVPERFHRHIGLPSGTGAFTRRSSSRSPLRARLRASA